MLHPGYELMTSMLRKFMLRHLDRFIPVNVKFPYALNLMFCFMALPRITWMPFTMVPEMRIAFIKNERFINSELLII